MENTSWENLFNGIKFSYILSSLLLISGLIVDQFVKFHNETLLMCLLPKIFL